MSTKSYCVDINQITTIQSCLYCHRVPFLSLFCGNYC